MNLKDCLKVHRPTPFCVGTGLIALDAVANGRTNESRHKLKAGGSCGNVLTILSFLGWNTYPIARLRDDMASRELVKDMNRWGLNTSLMSFDNSGSTPIIIVKTGIDANGKAKHNYKRVCPNCGKWLPRYKAVLAKDVDSIITKMPLPQVFYFDRFSRSSIELARYSKNMGALIMFEPSKISDDKLFKEALGLADIVKYSQERVKHADELTKDKNIPLEIQTCDAKGIRFRFGGNIEWQEIPAYTVKELKDTVGSGDWCSAGILHLLGSNGKESFKKAGPVEVFAALRFGQALAALNCYFEGARGSMYDLSTKLFKSLLQSVIANNSSFTVVRENIVPPSLLSISCVCPNCLKI